jgi:lipopolysaccharide export system protein LptA
MQMTSSYFWLRIVRASLIAIVCVLGSHGAWAEKADRAKPMNAESDALRYDDVKQISLFTGNVIITKGTMVIRGDTVEVRQDKEGFQFGTATALGGKRAFFRQKRDGSDEWIEGEAETIFYDGRADTVTYTKNATMRRLRGAAVSDETYGAIITYDNTSDVFNVLSGLGSGTAATGNPSGRVRAVIGPRGAPSAAVPTVPAPAPVGAPAGAPTGTLLRPSTNLAGEKK